MERLALGAIRTDGGTQPRAKISQAAVADYAESMQEGAEFPPLVVFYDGEAYFLADGFHRLRAMQRLGMREALCEVKSGRREEAVLYAAGANRLHGVRRSNADKRRAVEMYLSVKPGDADRKIAAAVGVSHPFVGTVREATETVTVGPRTSSDGRQGWAKDEKSAKRTRERVDLTDEQKKAARQVRESMKPPKSEKPSELTPREKLDRHHLKRVREAFEIITSLPFDGTEAFERFGIEKLGDKAEPATIWVSEFRGALEGAFAVPLKDGRFYPLSDGDVESWERAYPHIEVREQLYKCIAWNRNNPDKRKTKAGVRKHVNSWLARADKEARQEARTKGEAGSYTDQVGGTIL